MKRRGNGEGTIYQRADGRWCARYPVIGEGGKTEQKWVYGKTRKEVQTKVREAQALAAKGLRILTKQDTVQHFMVQWLDWVAEHRQANTHLTYQYLAEKHIYPILGTKRLDQVTPALVRAWLESLTSKGLSSATVRTVRGCLSSAYQYAVKMELVERNPVSLVEPPLAVSHDHAEASPDELRALMRAIQGHQYEGVYLLALLAGLRRGEALGLQWEDIDEQRGTLHIRRQLQPVPGGEYVLKKPKATRSVRLVALPQTLVPVLAQQRERLALWRAEAGDTWRSEWDGLVFRTPFGEPVSGRSVLREFHGICEQVGIDRQRLHDLRHHFASLAFALGAPAKGVQETLGHSSIGMTLDTYTHMREEQGQQVTRKVEEYLKLSSELSSDDHPHGPDSQA